MRRPARSRTAVRACGRETTMPGTPDSTVILHWDECQSAWARLSWRDWVRFRGLEADGLSLLVGAEAGEHYFLVCVLGDRGELVNVIPHRYVLSTDGRLVYGFDGLGKDERGEYCRIQVLRSPTTQDAARCGEFDTRAVSVDPAPPPT